MADPRGGSDKWDNGLAGALLLADYLVTSLVGSDVTGALAATESGTDTASLTGTAGWPAITGALAATESGTDTASLTSIVIVLAADRLARLPVRNRVTILQDRDRDANIPARIRSVRVA